MTRQINDLAYNPTQRLDLYLVEQPARPLIVCLHGGGFISGVRDDERCMQSVGLLTEAGFNCASISYSLAPAGDRFAMWPRNSFDVADALAWLHDQAATYGYNFNRLGMLGFSAGCCLSNLYILGGKNLFEHFNYKTPVYSVAALAGFYGPYDFPSRQRERRSDKHEINLYHSPSYWLRHSEQHRAPPVLHVHGDSDEVVLPDQHAAFQKDYEQRGYDFKPIIVEGFGHSFAPRDSNASGKSIDLGSEISEFFSQHLMDGTG